MNLLPGCPPVLLRVAFIDKIALHVPAKTDGLLELCRRERWLQPRITFRPDLRRIEVAQPTVEDILRVVEIEGARIADFEIALDLVPRRQEELPVLALWMARRAFWRSKRKGQVRVFKGTLYDRERAWASINRVAYADRHSKMLGALCLHYEWRIKGSRRVRNVLGSVDPANLLTLDLRKFIQKRLQLGWIDLGTFGRLVSGRKLPRGKTAHLRYRHTGADLSIARIVLRRAFYRIGLLEEDEERALGGPREPPPIERHSMQNLHDYIRDLNYPETKRRLSHAFRRAIVRWSNEGLLPPSGCVVTPVGGAAESAIGARSLRMGSKRVVGFPNQ